VLSLPDHLAKRPSGKKRKKGEKLARLAKGKYPRREGEMKEELFSLLNTYSILLRLTSPRPGERHLNKREKKKKKEGK